MALTDVQKVRHQIGDIAEPYVLSDSQIQDYLTSNSGSVDDTVSELRDIMMSYMASNNKEFRLGELYEDNTDRLEAYMRAVDKAERNKGKNAVPVIASTGATSVSIGMFDVD